MATFVRHWLEESQYWQQWIEDGRLITVHRSLNEQTLMDENKAIRSLGGPRKMDGLRPLLQMSEAQYKVLVKLRPDLESRDHVAQKKAWLKVAKDFPALTLKD